jgi:hypothetical protein
MMEMTMSNSIKVKPADCARADAWRRLAIIKSVQFI